MATLRFRPYEGITGYCALGGIAGLSTSFAPSFAAGLISGALFAIILGWLFKGCRWLFERGSALRQDAKSLRLDMSPKALAAWKSRLIERRAGLDQKSKIIWFSCLIVVMLIFGLIPPPQSGELFAIVFLAALGLMTALFIVDLYSAHMFARAIRDQSNRKD